MQLHLAPKSLNQRTRVNKHILQRYKQQNTNDHTRHSVLPQGNKMTYPFHQLWWLVERAHPDLLLSVASVATSSGFRLRAQKDLMTNEVRDRFWFLRMVPTPARPRKIERRLRGNLFQSAMWLKRTHGYGLNHARNNF